MPSSEPEVSEVFGDPVESPRPEKGEKDVKEENETKVILIGAKEEVLSARDYIYDIVDEEV